MLVGQALERVDSQLIMQSAAPAWQGGDGELARPLDLLGPPIL